MPVTGHVGAAVLIVGGLNRVEDIHTWLLHRYAGLTQDQGRTTAARIWREINGPNLVENILPTRSRASLVLTK